MAADKKAKKIKTLEDQLRVMERKLKEAKAQMPDENLVVEYNNGGGQSGTMANPFYTTYTKLMSCYVKTLTLWLEERNEQSAEITALSDIRSRLKVAK